MISYTSTYNVKKCRRILLIMILLSGYMVNGYSQTLTQTLTSYFNEVSQGRYPAIPKQILLSENSKVILPALNPYLVDSVASVRSKAYTLAALAGNNARQSHLRELAVDALVRGAKDVDGANVGAVLDYLTSFNKEDFTAVAKDSLRVLFRRHMSHFDKLLKLIGFIELTDLKSEIRPYTQTGNNQSIRWSALISLARMGDEASVSEVSRRARKLPVNDDVIYSIFPDLAFTRDRELIGYMVEVLQRDDATCMSADAERQAPIPCGYRIMEQLAPVIKGYPLELDASGDIKTNDYVAALKTVREWFTKHPNYEILKDKY